MLGIVEPGDRAKVLASLTHDVESKGNVLTAGDVGFRYLLEALALGDRSDLIYTLVNQDDKPGYGYQLKMGATSLCESWDANLTSSHNHFMLGQINEWFYKHLAGIGPDPGGAGFKKIMIRPQPVGDLAWASYDSIHGTIVSSWKCDGQKFMLNIRIPANTTATVFLPAKPADEVIENGNPAKQSEGVTFLRQEKEHAIFAVESGEYQFESR